MRTNGWCANTLFGQPSLCTVILTKWHNEWSGEGIGYRHGKDQQAVRILQTKHEVISGDLREEQLVICMVHSHITDSR